MVEDSGWGVAGGGLARLSGCIHFIHGRSVDMNTINVAIVGVGNCAKSLIEGVAFYARHPNETVGLIHSTVSGYSVSDISFVAAFDVDERKVGKKLSDAISAEPNRTWKIAEPESTDVVVKRGPSCDAIIPQAREFFIHESNKRPVDVAAELMTAEAEIVLNYVPTGSDEATYVYAEAALEAGCSFINCMPTSLARSDIWRRKFEKKGLVLLGDDIKSQLGATILNRTLLELMRRRGARVTKSDQTNFGGNADHFNLHFRPHAKEACKESALRSVLESRDAVPNARMIFTEKNYDHKKAEILVSGEVFGRVPVSIIVTLEDEDSPNSAGVVVDAIRAARVLRETGQVSRAPEVAASLMKAPPIQLSEAVACARFRKIVGGVEESTSRAKMKSPS